MISVVTEPNGSKSVFQIVQKRIFKVLIYLSITYLPIIYIFIWKNNGPRSTQIRDVDTYILYFLYTYLCKSIVFFFNKCIYLLI